MRKAFSAVVGLPLIVATAFASRAESTREFSVQVSATVQSSPAQINLSWPQDSCSAPSSYTLYRKAPGATFWGAGTILPGTATNYVDRKIILGTAYEYQIVKATPQYTGYGYICSGVDVPPTEYRGKLLLVVDNTYAAKLTKELSQLQQDLLGDGWMVTRIEVSRSDSVIHVKNLIKAQYKADPANVKALFLLGHVPVPYAGDIVPDGHAPDHQGAWPCDGFYGDMDGVWTDNLVNDTSATEPRTRNIPGDGKFDQSTFPAPLKLMVGRVDLANLPGRLRLGGEPTFPSELELLRNYLNKDHKFRMKQFDLPRRAFVGDYFGTRNGEAFAASGWRNFAPFFGVTNIINLPNKGTWISTLSTNTSLWAYGCGAGSFTSIGGMGNSDNYNDGTTTELVQNDIKAAFTLLFGSWLGDWDSEDDILRSVLALPTYGLTAAWSGRPHWFLHHMALGEPIGFGARLTQNNGPGGLYQNQLNSCAGQIHIALMGDPTLRMHVVAPPANIVTTTNAGRINLGWSPSSDCVVGYHVYGATNANGPFTRLTAKPVTTLAYADSSEGQRAAYMVRAVKLETSASGSYYNLSQGVFSNPGNGLIDDAIVSLETNSPAILSSTNHAMVAPRKNLLTPTGLMPSWIDDAVPAGAVAAGEGGDSWNWVSSNPSPFSGNLAHQSSIASGVHQHYFSGASAGLMVNSGDVLFAYVYLDPTNLPAELMLQWNNGSWEHRAYWGANKINLYGVNGTATRRYMGPLPPAGQWVRLEVPASQVGLEGSTLNGMAFTLYGGRATWDNAGSSSSSTTSTTNSPGAPPTATISLPAGAVVWMDDTLPGGAVPNAEGGDTWSWINSNPTPAFGNLAHQSSFSTGLHQHFFTGATSVLIVNSGDTLYGYVFIDPNNLPQELILQWNDGDWEHRAYWGANVIDYGVDGTSSRWYMGALPPAGQWARLEVPASHVGLEGSTLNGMAFTLFGGRATWDNAGKYPSSVSTTPPVTSTNSPPANTNTTSSSVTWVEDALPAGAVPGTDGGDSWNWVSSNPSPESGALANQSSLSAGLHQHFFSGATQTLTVNSNDVLFAYVYMDGSNLPSELMLQWNDGSWEHRAYWGANNVSYGVSGTSSRHYMGTLPPANQWARLEVPAGEVGLEGSTLNGMAFTLYDGRATWDNAGKAFTSTTGSTPAPTNAPPIVSTNAPVTDTNSQPIVSTNSPTTPTNTPPIVSTNTPPSTNNTPVVGTNALPGMNLVDYTMLAMPPVTANTLHVLTPSLLELKLINTKQPDPARVAQWDLVNSSGQFVAPPIGAFSVTANGQLVNVSGVGFKRRPLYAPVETYDLRIENSLYLQLSASISDNQTIEVKNPDGTLWSSITKFIATSDPLRYSPAIHVNQEGYMPNYTKNAMVGYYAGSLGEVAVPASSGFKLVDAVTGAQVFQGALVQRPDVGYSYSPTPYQKVYEADFTSFNTPGEYRMVVPGMGGSLPFMIDAGIGMNFARAYALGLYHQRCGTNTAMPYTRFTHDICHNAPASVPLPESSFTFTWNTVAGYGNTINATQTAPALNSPSAQLFPFVRQGAIDTSGGHHDAGDYSKYTINSASLVHYLMFAVDSIAGIAALDNLGIPESGDGISDVMQEAKWEADYLAKIQDSDGGFYFLVYPQNREYEGNVTPDHGDPQVVWPKTTSVTAAAVAALAQCASSPLFKQTYPAAATLYLQKAQLGWKFLTNALAKYGQNGAYQKITHYGDNYADRDEMAWAACQIFLATGDASAHQQLLSWFDPSDSATWRWGWWRMSECYGHAIRSYAFAVQSGRIASASQLDATFLSKCQAQIAAAGDDTMNWSQQSAYGTSFPSATKAVQGGGWYFSCDQAFDITVAYQLNPKPAYMNALLANMNYEGGCNPINLSYITGVGWKRQRDIVSQWAANDIRVLPPSGIPVGNVTASFGYLGIYGTELEGLCFPSDTTTTAPYPYYDRWGDSWNVTAEMVVLNQARGLGTLAFIAAQTPYKTQAWRSVAGQISAPTTVTPVGSPVTVSLQAPGVDLSAARITWEARDQEPAFGSTFTFAPKNNGVQWVEAEAQLPDGRRIFASTTFNANSPNIVWVEDAIPSGATGSGDGGDTWNWISANPAPFSGALAHQSALAAGSHQHYFDNATATLAIGTGDVMYAYVYLDPSNPPSEIMLQWNDGSWEHRAYWGANNLGYGLTGTPSRYYAGLLPAAGQWVQLKVPASQVNLEGSILKGMAFTLYNGRATWDAAGRLAQVPLVVVANPTPAIK